MNQLIGGPSMGFEVIADNAVQKMKLCKEQNKECSNDNTVAALVTLFEREDIRIGIYCPQDEEEAEQVQYKKSNELGNFIVIIRKINFLQDLNFFFNPKNGLQATLRLKNSTLGIIKPHCIKDGLCILYINIYVCLKQQHCYNIFTGNLGRIISEITDNGFKITGLRMNLMERVNCEEFFEVYRGILPEYIVSMHINTIKR